MKQAASKTVHSSEILGNCYLPTWHHIPDDGNLDSELFAIQIHLATSGKYFLTMKGKKKVKLAL
jgi:hypothetical protein